MNSLAAAFERPIAHRGLHNTKVGIIENSADAFAAAISADYAIECDIQLTGDDVAVVFHDYKLDRLTSQQGNLSHISADQLCRIPINGSRNTPQTFSSFLEQINGQVPLVVELKPHHNGALARAVIKDARNYRGPLVFKSFDPEVLYYLRQERCKWPVGVVLERKKPKKLSWSEGFFLRHLLHYPWTRFDFISCNVDSLELPVVRLFRAIGYKVMTWTVKSQTAHKTAAAHADQVVFEGDLTSERDKRVT